MTQNSMLGSKCYNDVIMIVNLTTFNFTGSESAPSGRPARNLPSGLQRLLNQSSDAKEKPLFHLCYEFKPFNSTADYRYFQYVKYRIQSHSSCRLSV